MAKKNETTNQIGMLSKELKKMMRELFGEVLENDGVLRSRVNHLGVTDAAAIVDVMLEGGLREEAPYGVLHFHTTFAENVPEESLADLLIALNGLNHVVSAGAFPGFGTFAYYDPLEQIYLSYRMPVNLNQIEAEYDNIRYYLGCLYEQMDLFMDFLMFTIVNPGAMTIGDYMEYLDEMSDINNLEERLKIFEDEFENMVKKAGLNLDDIEENDEDSDDKNE
ncbi:MAG: hypothetical protein E7274_05055 [Pseudobutyrivibrio ruminis]|uniref:hypothetical protein n=1 Tax=Pseudobutyrivibrio ruminis TaxID=46206 RepID=UPI0026ECC2D4|nr:hypothetical protein [Pseudobutyrivibrio ruminis]MBE5913407.1 hypothetical protein [Pseudobutyrivibrio ruminis]